MDATQQRRRSALDAGLAVCLVLAAALTFAPWIRTGAVRRTSHEVLRAAERLDVLAGGPAAAVPVLWALLPLAAALGVLALARGARRAAAGLGLGVGLLEVAMGLAVMRAPRSADWGAGGAVITGLLLVVVAIVALAVDERSAA
ncbi:MAG: hypothetical protein KDA97_11020 [Acidimicrobiales bacterium]|nr:hypothetical protein [Acidimicrobiales bacterium]